jgi:preprotein translocase subunit SecF
VTATLFGLIGILLFIAFRYDWTYAAGAVIAVFHDVLMVLAFFSIFQWEINLTVIAAILTIVGFSVNDSIVIFDRVRENLVVNRTDSLFKITNDSINQTLSRTIITAGLVLLSVLALVLFGGEVLKSFSLALLVGVTLGTYSTIAIASPSPSGGSTGSAKPRSRTCWRRSSRARSWLLRHGAPLRDGP